MKFSEVTIGTAPMGSRYDENRSLRVLAAALEAGISAIDTAPSYGYGAAERIVGKALVRTQAEPIVITKVGIRATSLAKSQLVRNVGRKVLQLGGPVQRALRSAVSSQRSEAPLSPDFVDQSIEASLRALGREISFVVLHGVDLRSDHAKVCLTRLSHHVSAGRIQGIGVSGTSEMVDACADVVDVSMLQTPVRLKLPPGPPPVPLVLGYSPFGTIPAIAETAARYVKWADAAGCSVSFEAAVLADIDATASYTSLISTMGSIERVDSILNALTARNDPAVVAAAQQLRSMYADQL